MPLEGLKLTPDKSLLTVQLRLPCEPAANATVVLQVQPPSLCGQFAPAVNVSSLMVSTGGDAQLNPTCTLLTGPLKARALLVGQSELGAVIVTCIVWPGVNVPFDGEKVTPFSPLPDADQSRLL